MPVHSFTAEIAGFVRQGLPYEDAFFEAGCDDALIVIVDDKMRLDFDREAASYEAAVQSAYVRLNEQARGFQAWGEPAASSS